MTLLDEAKKIDSKVQKFEPLSDEEIELSVAWVRGEITTKQYYGALNRVASGNSLYRVAMAMKVLYKQGGLTFK